MFHFSGLAAPSGVFTDLSVSVSAGQVVCITGPNGSGKTTLLTLIAERTGGRHGAFPPGAGFLPQCDARILSETFGMSPGQVQRQALTSLFHEAAGGSLLLLDEPSNHLDAEAFVFLHRCIRAHCGPMLVVTHDVRLLAIADRILHLEAGKLWDYGGGYDLYVEQRGREAAARAGDAVRAQGLVKSARRELHKNLASQRKRRNQAERENKTQRNPKALVNFQRNRADRTEARFQRVHQRIVQKNIESEKRARDAALPRGVAFKLALPEDKRPGGAVYVSGLNRHVHGHWLWDRDLSFTVAGGGRLAVTGPNGAGKSTLFRMLAGLSGVDHGRITVGRVVLLDQRLSILDTVQTPLELIMGLEQMREGRARTILAGIGFQAERVFLPLSRASGGERMRLSIAFALLGGAATLVLDEPTNDLDEEARREVVEIVSNMPATVIVATHDHLFLEEAGITDVIRLSLKSGTEV
ncbi:MAG: ABC-F family ATP-binding cassette domain-containing protein [Spirochaetia bacterium]|nr:ABC-F family ATP-binding cassette domain-containing protein [Spirochaetia bacterium]